MTTGERIVAAWVGEPYCPTARHGDLARRIDGALAKEKDDRATVLEALGDVVNAAIAERDEADRRLSEMSAVADSQDRCTEDIALRYQDGELTREVTLCGKPLPCSEHDFDRYVTPLEKTSTIGWLSPPEMSARGDREQRQLDEKGMVLLTKAAHDSLCQRIERVEGERDEAKRLHNEWMIGFNEDHDRLRAEAERLREEVNRLEGLYILNPVLEAERDALRAQVDELAKYIPDGTPLQSDDYTRGETAGIGQAERHWKPKVETLRTQVGELREALNDQTTGLNCWCDREDLEPGEVHTDYCIRARLAFASTPESGEGLAETLDRWTAEDSAHNVALIERCARVARDAKFPESHQWGVDALEGFEFGKATAAAAILALKGEK